ncbi:uncharacterized protein LY89DRAFT_738970 [Mollisia scopiformis]|uniref:Uncharacterized protein n=1 Tax=Mollisia scopiformis TaxID=149040 RepID=A0A194WUA3_MOLSC|nr:uncharacterized protein LY89DRAFT_738970 [Mollisia scopiformis]KUJ11538.1 hypothetical protein LY89DRAFT_738970 [Mollisia scopiformis]
MKISSPIVAVIFQLAMTACAAPVGKSPQRHQVLKHILTMLSPAISNAEVANTVITRNPYGFPAEDEGDNPVTTREAYGFSAEDETDGSMKTEGVEWHYKR